MTVSKLLKSFEPQFPHLLNWNANTHRGFKNFLVLSQFSSISIWKFSSATLYPLPSTLSLQECRTWPRRDSSRPWPWEQFVDEHVTSSDMSASEHLGGSSLFPAENRDTGRLSSWSSSRHLPPHGTWEQRQHTKENPFQLYLFGSYKSRWSSMIFYLSLRRKQCIVKCLAKYLVHSKCGIKVKLDCASHGA